MVAAFKNMRLAGLVAIWIFALAFYAIRSPAFFSLANVSSILQFSTLLALVTLGQTLVILAGGGGIDLSVGGIVSLSGLAIAFLLKAGMPGFAAALAGVVFGGILGCINGLVITRLRLVPLIVTLGT